jgi:hypothetical protein
LPVIEFLLGYEAGLRISGLLEPLVGGMRRSMGRLRALQVPLSPGNLLLRRSNCGVRGGELCGKFRDFEDGKRLSFFDMIADIDVNHLDIARDFGMHVDILKRLERAGDGERVAQVAPLDECHGGRCFVHSVRLRIGILPMGLRAA